MELKFKDKEAERLFIKEESKKYRAFQEQAYNRLSDLEAANEVDDLLFPTGNHLKKLKGKRKDEWSVRINRQWRICFKVDGNIAYDIKIEDYH